MKILIVRFSSIGDIVLTTPIVRCAKKQIPEAEIHYLTKASFAKVLENNPYIDKIITVDKRIEPIKTILQQEKYDCIIDLHKNLRSFKVRYWLKNADYYTFDKLNFEKWMMVNFKWNILPEKHIVDRYFEGVKSLNIEDDELGLDFFISKKDEINVANEFGLIQPFNVIVLGAAHFTKRIPENKIKALVSKQENPVVLIGGKEETNLGEIIAKEFPDKIHNACGKYNIAQSASIVNQSAKVYSSDTGMMHISAALQKPMVVVWGNTIPEFGMYPYYGKKSTQHYINVENKISCRPCSKIGFQKCPRNHFNCMQKNEIIN